jgi:uncharacterized glyoxalase superfamily protein PhnB
MPRRRLAMTENSTKLAGSGVIPSMRYREAHKAIAWLVRALGFTAQAVYDGPDGTVAHAQLTLGRGMIMLGSAKDTGFGAENWVQPDEIGRRSTHSVYLVVEDATAAYERAKAAGAEFTMELREMEYGGKGFGCKDPEGHSWSVGEYDPWA